VPFRQFHFPESDSGEVQLRKVTLLASHGQDRDLEKPMMEVRPKRKDGRVLLLDLRTCVRNDLVLYSLIQPYLHP